MANSTSLPRYVLLEHQWDGVHYDLMFECQCMLRTWKLSDKLQHGEQFVTELSTHRMAYLEYEGPVSNDRGTVTRIAAGTFHGNIGHDADITLQLTGTLHGTMLLKWEHDAYWKLIWKPNVVQRED